MQAAAATVAGWQDAEAQCSGSGSGINYSSRLERFETKHWDSQKNCSQREADIEAAAEEPLLGPNGSEDGTHQSIFGLPMVRPTSRIAVTTEGLTTLVDMTYTAFLVPICIAFNEPISWDWLGACDLAAGAIFTLAIFVQLHTGIIVRYNLQRKVVMCGATVARMHLFQGTMLIDIASALPAWIEVSFFLGWSSMPSGNVLRVLLCLRWLRMLRLVMFVQAQFVVNVLRNLGRRVLSWQFPLQILYLGDIMFCALVLTNLLGMAWVFTAVLEGTENSWMASVGDQNLAINGTRVDQYFAAVFFAMTTMSTNGYGDVVPKNTVERAVAIVIMMVGVLFFGYVISSLSVMLQMFSPEARRAVIFRDKINRVDSWMSYRHLPNTLRSDITGYYANSWVPQSEIQEAQLFEELPAFLRGEVATHLVGPILQELSLWQAMPERERWRLAALLHPQQLLPGHDLCQEGEFATGVWLLQEGELLAIKDAVRWERLSAPALVGEEALQAEGSPMRKCTFRAVGGCTLWGLDRKEVEPLLKVFPDMVASLSTRSTGSRILRSLNLQGLFPTEGGAAHNVSEMNDRSDDSSNGSGNHGFGPIADRGKRGKHPRGGAPHSEEEHLPGT